MKFLIPDAGGIIERQFISGLREAGHGAVGCFFNPYGSDNDGALIRKTVDDTGSEAIFCYADDDASTLLKASGELGIPLLIWHLDAPYGYFLPERRRDYRRVIQFCMDRYYANLLPRLGYEQVTYLPLATSPEVFPSRENRDAQAEVGFVGNLESVKAKRIWDVITANWKHAADYGPLINRLIESAAGKGIDVPAVVQVFLDMKLDLALSLYLVKFLETAAIRERRVKPAEALDGPFSLKVAGNGWEYTNIPPAHIIRRLDYYRGLSSFYCSSRINLNVTEPQVKAGLNQRFYDVPAGNGFLITNRHDEIEHLFIPGKEIVIYEDIPDLLDKVRYYLAHPQEREEIAGMARAKVLAHHTMKQRMETAVEILRAVKGI